MNDPKITSWTHSESERIRLLLDSSPLACRMWNRDYQIFECNEEALKFFQLHNKQEMIDRFFEFSPQYQPDGQLSTVKAKNMIDIAFEEGRHVREWLHQLPDGTPLPCEVTLVRIRYGQEDVVAAYSRDLREHKRMMADIEKHEQLLSVINRIAVVLLAAAAQENFEESLIRGMELIGQCLDADCVQIWPNEVIDGQLHFVLKYKWLSALGQKAPPVPIGTALAYSKRWKELFLRGENVNGPISSLPVEDQELLGPLALKSTITIPLFEHDHFWGVFCVDDCERERFFAEGEINILHSAALMLVSAISRNAQAAQLREAHTRTQLMLDSTPLAIHLWDRNYNLFDINEEAVRMFGMANKQDYLAHFQDMSPEYQPNGSRSEDLKPIYIAKAFEEGTFTFQWAHQRLDGTPIPAEVTLVRVAYGHGYAVAAYVRDLREYNKMMDAIHESATKLEEALSDTQRANDAKSEFLAGMSHEMRTPLNAVIGLSGLCLEDASLTEETRLYLEKIYSSGDMLLSIVNDILDISKIEAGKMELVEVDYDVPSLINDTITQNVFRIGEKPITLKLDIGEDIYSQLYGDELRVKQIMNNLLSNAIKYTHRGTVTLGFECERVNGEVWVRIRVADTGIGIRPEDLSRLFSDYSQMDLRRNRKTEGTGLGLPIAKSLAEMMGGTIEVVSEYGKGSVFTVTLTQRYVSDVRIGPEVMRNLKSFRYTEDKRGRNAQIKRISLPYARVLVVDDNYTNLDVAKGLLKPYDMRVDCVASGFEAIEAIRAETPRYDAVFMDHMMPELDGIAATRIIREEIGTEYAKNLPIIALTANAIAGNEAMFLSKGFQAFIPKPIELGRLDEVIRRWVRGRDHERIMAEMYPDEDGYIERSESERRSGIDRRVLGMGINGLQIDKGIERFGGDKDVYFDVLRSFVTNTPPLLDTIEGVIAENLPSYAVIVHGIKGSSRSICAEPMGDIAENLEKHAKDGDMVYVRAHNADFLRSARQLISDISELIALEYPSGPKPVKERPDRELLQALLDACKHFDTDEIDRIVALLDMYTYESEDELAGELINCANHYNFKEIREILTALFAGGEARDE